MSNKNETAGKTAMQVFNFNRKTGTPVRVQVINDEPWFVSEEYGKTIIAWAAARKLSVEMRQHSLE